MLGQGCEQGRGVGPQSPEFRRLMVPARLGLVIA